MKHRNNDYRRRLRTEYSRMPEAAVIERARTSDSSAMEYLLYKYRSLVSTKARYYYLIGAETSDLIQIGMIGLWRAVIDYTPDKDISFLSFARICIERHIISSIKKATRMKQSPLNTAVSLDHQDQRGDQEGLPVVSACTPHHLQPLAVLIRREERAHMQSALQSVLSEFEWKVLNGYGKGKSYVEIADDLGCKTKSVDNALERIRSKATRKCLAHTMDASLADTV